MVEKTTKTKQTKSNNNNSLVLTNEINKIVYIRNIECEQDDERGYTNYFCEYSYDKEHFIYSKIQYLPQQLKTRLKNMQLKENEIVSIKYHGKRKSTLSDREYHAFFVEKVDVEQSEEELYEELKKIMSENEIEEKINQSIERMKGIINRKTAMFIVLKDSQSK